MHIFWQKRIREGDTGNPAEGGTPYWFPGVTGAGAIGEDRIVLPIPPGTHWSDAKPVVLPEGPLNRGDEIRLLEDEVARLERERKQKGARGDGKGSRGEDRGASDPAKAKARPVRRANVGGLHFGATPEVTPEVAPGASPGAASTAGGEAERAAAQVEQELKEAKRALRREKKKFDPAQVAFARELKDRWLEQVQREPGLLAPGAEKYAVRRCIEAVKPCEPEVVNVRRLDAA